MALRQKLTAFLETRELKELKDTAVAVLFEFVRGELKKTQLWKFIVVAELMWTKYSIIVPKKSVDRVEGSYVEKTKYIRDNERELAKSLLETLEFHMVTDDEGKWNVSADMLNPHAYALVDWIVYGNESIANEALRCYEPMPDDFTTYAYEEYRIKTNRNTVLKCAFLNHRKLFY